MEEIKRGDIFYVVNNYQEEGSEQRAGRPAVIVSNDKGNTYSGVVEIVYLTTQQKTDLPTHIDIRSTPRPSIALCEQITSISKSRLGDYIASCNEYELDMLNAAMLISLGIEIAAPAPVEVKKAPEQPADVKTVFLPNNDVLIKAETERDTYKRLYETLLEKVIVGRIAV